MARNYISGKVSLPEGPIPGVGGLDQLEMADTQNLTFGDNERLYFGDGPDAYFYWDASALQLVSALGTITGQKQGLNITVTGSLSSGDGLIGLQVNATPTGTAGRIALGEFISFAMSTQAVSGYVACSEFESHLSGSYNVCSNAVLVLDYWNDNTGSPQGIQAYVFLQDYGTVAMQNLLYFLSKNRASASNSVILSQRGTVAGGTIDTMVRCVDSDGTPFWLLAATGGPAGQPDFKVMGSVTANYLEWDASADRLNVVVATRTVTGEEHAVDVSYAGALTAGEMMVGCNVAVAPTGTGGTWVSAFFGKVTVVGNALPGTGYCSGAEFEVNYSSGITPSDMWILSLNAGNNASMSPNSAFIALHQYGSALMLNLFTAPQDTIGAHDSSNMVRETSGIPAVNDANWKLIQCRVGGTLLYIAATATAPAA